MNYFPFNSGGFSYISSQSSGGFWVLLLLSSLPTMLLLST